MITWVDIPVIQLARAIEFYQHVLQVDVLQQQGEIPSAILCQQQHSLKICLLQHSNLKPSFDGPLLYLQSSRSLESATNYINQFGGKTLEAPQPLGKWGSRLLFIDSEGNKLALVGA